MSEELYELYLEIKDYLVEDKEQYEYVLKEDVPIEIKEKYKKYKSMNDDIIIEDSE